MISYDNIGTQFCFIFQNETIAINMVIFNNKVNKPSKTVDFN